MKRLLVPLLFLSIAAHADEPAPRWWKGNLHTHSLWSDGDDFPEMIAGWHKERGWHFLALSDHNILSDHELWIKTSRAGAVAIGEVSGALGRAVGRAPRGK